MRVAWMRKYRRALEGRGYVIQEVVTGKNHEGSDIVRKYVLKDDGREVFPGSSPGEFLIAIDGVKVSNVV